MSSRASETNLSLRLIDREKVGSHVATVLRADAQIGHVGAGLTMRGLFQPFLHVRGRIRVIVHKSPAPVPVFKRWSACAGGHRNSRNDVAGNAGMLPKLLATCLWVASGESSPALEIQIAQPTAGGQGQDQRQQNEGRQFLHL